MHFLRWALPLLCSAISEITPLAWEQMFKFMVVSVTVYKKIANTSDLM